MTTGEKIRAIRKSKGLTQKQVGEFAGIAEPTIRRYELDKLHPKVETLQKIADALKVSVYELFGMDDLDTDTLEKNMIQCGCSLGQDKETGRLWINFPDGTLAVSETDLKELESETVLYLSMKLLQLKSKHEADFQKRAKEQK